MNRIQVIQSLIDKCRGTSYLEIGVQNGNCFRHVQCDIKIGVDPESSYTENVFRCTSDTFFKSYVGETKFDVVFIDGLHYAEQVERDIQNSLKHLKTGGFVVVHDCNPKKEEEQIVPRQTKRWNGDVWKAWVKLRSSSDFEMFVVDTDEGCGVIYPSSKVLTQFSLKDELTYKNLEKNRREWLNLITVEDFQKWLEQGKVN